MNLAKLKDRFVMPDTYVIIFFIVFFSWILTFIIPAGKYTTEEQTYDAGSGNTITRTVLEPDSFRYMHQLKEDVLVNHLEDLDEQTFQELKVDQTELEELLQNNEGVSIEQLEEIVFFRIRII